MNRRVFLQVLGAAVAVAGCRVSLDDHEAAPDAEAMVTPDGASCASCLDLADPANAPLTKVGGSRVVAFAGKNVLVARVSDSEFIALSAICTHAGCTVRFAGPQISCPCHGSLFALDGSVTRGPANQPLAKFAATFDPSTNVVTLAV